MKKTKLLLWMTPLALLIAGCAVPVRQDTTISEWQRDGMLPPTGGETSRVYPHPADYPAMQPGILVESNNGRNSGIDAAVANGIRRKIEYDLGLAPSLKYVTIEVQDGRVILEGTVKSEFDARVIVDSLRDVAGVGEIADRLEIDPDV